MAASSFERRFTPLIILLLVAALVLTIGLWASGRAAQNSINTGVAGTAVGDEHFEWKMVTTWPKNFPGLGVGAQRLENAARDLPPLVVADPAEHAV